MKSFTSRIALATALSFALATPVFAEQPGTTAAARQEPRADEPEEQRDVHDRGDILVSAEGLRELDFIAGQDVLEVAEIQRNFAGQLGELLIKVPGVSATSFAPGASRPILRGLDGERVRVLIDGIGTADVGNTSADHATTIDPLTVQRVEVLRGPGALLFGSQAIGGVVNVIDRRIPVAVPEETIHVDALFAADTVADLRSGGASLDAAVTENIVLHLDGSFRETGNLEIPGFQVTPGLRNELLAEAAEEEAEGEFEEAEEFREAAAQEGFIPNSDLQTWTVNGGVGFIFGESSFGASVGYFDTDYGVIKRPGSEHAHGEEEHGDDHDHDEDHGHDDDHDEDHDHEHGEGEEDVRIGLEQLRVDLRGDIALGDGLFSRLKLRGGYSDYTHTEFEGAEVGTVFDSETIEARAELVQRRGGIVGAQFKTRDFSAVGEEAFVAPNETTQFALFTVQEIDLGGFQVEAAGRYERVDT
ncbi:MAG: TonB-dependent receptor plug domain-containing protein, partial [Erythrobacter sp.]